MTIPGAQKIMRAAIAVALVLPSVDAWAGDDCESAFVVEFPPTETQWTDLLTQAGDRIRIHVRPGIETQNAMPLEVSESWWNESALWVEPIHGVQERYAWDSIDRIDVHQAGGTARRIGRGALLGFAIGAAVGAMVGVSGDSEGDFAIGPSPAMVAGLFAGIGLVIGTVIGAALPHSRWVPTFCAGTSIDAQP